MTLASACAGSGSLTTSTRPARGRVAIAISPSTTTDATTARTRTTVSGLGRGKSKRLTRGPELGSCPRHADGPDGHRTLLAGCARHDAHARASAGRLAGLGSLRRRGPRPAPRAAGALRRPDAGAAWARGPHAPRPVPDRPRARRRAHGGGGAAEPGPDPLRHRPL